MRQMIMVGFLQAQNCTNLASSWRHRQSRTDSWSPDFYRHIGRVLEAGKFHLGFFDDRLSMPDMYGRDHGHTVKHGIRCVKLDAVTVLTVLGMATERLGLGATYSTSYYEPFHVARVFATLDLMTQGRAAWNVVTSLNDGEAQNMGRDEVLGHDLRYDRADEFMEIVLGHWDAWEDDAIVQDKATGLVRQARQGASPRLCGPLFPFARTVHRAALGAGPSGPHPGRIERPRQEFRRALGRDHLCRLSEYRGRQARLCRASKPRWRVSAAIRTTSRSPISSIRWRRRPRAEAEDKWAEIEKLPLEIDALSLLSEALNFDFAKKGMDEVVHRGRAGGACRACKASATGRRSVKPEPDRARLHRDQRPRPRSQRHRRRPEGSRRPAGRMVHRAGLRRLRALGDACAGHLRGFRAIRRAGTAAPRPVPQATFTGTTLRENLGLAVPPRGAWRAPALQRKGTSARRGSVSMPPSHQTVMNIRG